MFSIDDRLKNLLVSLVPLRTPSMLVIGPRAEALSLTLSRRFPSAKILTQPSNTLDISRLHEIPFETIVLSDRLEEYSDPKTLLRDVRSVISPTGSLIISAGNAAHWEQICGLFANFARDCRVPTRIWTPIDFCDLLWQHGFVSSDYYSVESESNESSHEIAALVHDWGVRVQDSLRLTQSHTFAYRAMAAPDLSDEPEKLSLLLGPHVGALGSAMVRTSIVITTYNSIRTIKECLESVIRAISPHDEVIVVDNGSTDATVESISDFLKPESNIRFIENGRNLGYSAGSNVGILQSKGEFIVLLNPDTKVWPGWIERLIKPLVEDVGIVGPLSDNTAGDQFVDFYTKSRSKLSIDELAKQVGNFDQAKYRETKLLMGFCLALRRDLLDKFGLLDENLFLGADDLEISWRLRCLGYRLLVAHSVFVHHDQGVSFASITTDERIDYVHRSDSALVAK